MASSLGPGRARVVFDEVLWAEDLERASAAARETAHQTRQRLECDGQAVAELLALRPDGPLGLPNCAKVYLPPPKGKWGVVLRFAMDGAASTWSTWPSACATRPRTQLAGACTSSLTPDSTGGRPAAGAEQGVPPAAYGGYLEPNFRDRMVTARPTPGTTSWRCPAAAQRRSERRWALQRHELIPDFPTRARRTRRSAPERGTLPRLQSVSITGPQGAFTR